MSSLVESIDLARDLLAAAGIDHPNILGARSTLATARRQAKALERELGRVDDELAPTVHELAAYWRDRCGHPRAKMDGTRYRAVRARLRDGNEPEYIKRAIDGAAAAPNVNERTGERYDDLALICRNQVKLDSFVARAPRGDGGQLERKLIGA